MTSQPGRSSSGKLTRRERRAQGAPRTYRVPSASGTVRRSYMVEPQVVDYTAEAAAIRHDLRRLLLWASILIVAMVALSFLPIAL